MRTLSRRQLGVLWTLVVLVVLGLVIAKTVWFKGGVVLFGVSGFLLVMFAWHFAMFRRS